MDIIRAWKDPEYRKTLDSATFPQHPSGVISLDDNSLDNVAGGTGLPTAAPCATTVMTRDIRICTGTVTLDPQKRN